MTCCLFFCLELPATILGSHVTPNVETRPGFHTPVTSTEILQSEFREIGYHDRHSSKLTKDHRSRSSRGVDSRAVDSRAVDSRAVDSRAVDSRRVESRRVESRGVESRNNESNMYAYDTFSSEDDQDCSKGYNEDNRSCSAVSQTSSISLPLSARESDKSIPRISKASRKASQFSNPSDKSNKLLRQRSHTSNKSNKSSLQPSHTSDKSSLQPSHTSDKSSLQPSHTSDKSFRQRSHTSDKSNKSLQQRSVSPDKSNKIIRQHSNISDEFDKFLHGHSKSLSQHSGVSDKPDKSYSPDKLSYQVDASDSMDRLNSSRLSSVKLQRYMGGNTSVTSGINTLDMLDDSRPGTQASINTLPDDNNLSPIHVASVQRHAKENEENSKPSAYSPIKDIDVSPEECSPLPVANTPNVPVSPDEVNMRPNSSILSPRKSKHSAASFQVSKRTHGMEKLEERPVSELSGDTTMREIDMLLGEEGQLTSGSSVIMTTDETISPIGSANIPRKYKHYNQASHGLYRFDKRQVNVFFTTLYLFIYF